MADVNAYLAACICILGGIFIWRKWKSERKDLPPSVPKLSILRNIGNIGRHAHIQFDKWSKVYGPLFRVKLGAMDMVIINDHKLIKEIFNEKASAGRTLDSPLTYELSKGVYGVVNAEGAVWEQQRRFMLRTLRNFGFAKTSMETMILDEAHALVQWFHKFNGSPVTGVRVFNAPVVNSLWRIVNGNRCAWEEKRPEILDFADEFFASFAKVTSTGFMFAPFIRHIIPEYIGWGKYCRSVERLRDLFEETVKEHQETFDANNIRDFVDCFLEEMEKCTDESSSFNQKEGLHNLIASVFDLFTAGSETMSNTLSWSMKYLIAYPIIQEKLFKEINQVLGTRMPSLADRSDLPYVESFISEVFRKSAIVPLGVPHQMMEGKMFNGYYLPKGVYLFSNIYAVHHNKSIWGDPENFRPERFLNEDGTKFVKNEALMPFAEGKRKCIGETLARDTLFLFVTSIVQEFQVMKENDEAMDMTSEYGFFEVPRPFKMKLVARNKQS